jgi:thioredoxin-like negative regulator of GroEL
VEALPTLILFHKGQVVDRYVGYMNADDLERVVTSVSEIEEKRIQEKANELKCVNPPDIQRIRPVPYIFVCVLCSAYL